MQRHLLHVFRADLVFHKEEIVGDEALLNFLLFFYETLCVDRGAETLMKRPEKGQTQADTQLRLLKQRMLRETTCRLKLVILAITEAAEEEAIQVKIKDWPNFKPWRQHISLTRSESNSQTNTALVVNQEIFNHGELDVALVTPSGALWILFEPVVKMRSGVVNPVYGENGGVEACAALVELRILEKCVLKIILRASMETARGRVVR